MSIRQRKPARGLLHHSDRGSRYCGKEYQNLPNRPGMLCSVSRRGDCRDNAPMESFFHTLKTELTHHRNYKTRQEAESGIFTHIGLFYNPKRRHSSLGYRFPNEFGLKTKAA